MVLGRIADFIAAATTRLSTSSSYSNPQAPGLPPLPVSHRASNYGTAGPKNILRHSSSLQDFSAYRRLDPVAGDVNSEFLRNANLVKKPFLHKENAWSTFSKDKSSPGKPKQRKWMRLMLIVFCLILVAGLIFALQVMYFSWSKEMPKYYVVLDCGSTGTRVFVYRASANHQKDASLPILVKSFPEDPHSNSSSKSGRAYNRMETEPGLGKLVHNISGLRGAIEPLVQWAKKQIPENAHKSTSLFLYATAGLRRLPSVESEWVLENAWSILKTSPFLCKREWVKIISGMEEAYFGWIALNYHSGTLGTIPNRKTFGALDLGGSSLQVTFESETETSDETSIQLSIGPVNQHLSAYSLSGYGLNDAFDKSVVYLVKKLHHMTDADLLSGKVEIKHPCLQSGYNEQYMCSHCASALQEGGPSAEGNKWGKGEKTGVTIRLTGAPKWEECRELARVAVNLSEWSSQSPAMDCKLQPCALANHLPHPHGNFYAMSGFYVVYRFFNLTPEAALNDVLEKGQEFCEKSWDIAKNSVVPQPFIEQYCFRAPYVVSLLREGLHIPDSYVAIGSGSITWTIGVALLEAGKTVPTRIMFQSYERLKMKVNPAILFGVLFLSLSLLLCALFCIGNVASKYFRRPYLPLFRHNNLSSTSGLNIPAHFRFPQWSSISPGGEGRVKLPLSPTIANTQPNPFGGIGIQLTESPVYRASSVSHSLSSDSLSHMQFENSSIGSLWTPDRSQMRLQSRRSQSREDLHLSLAEAHLAKV